METIQDLISNEHILNFHQGVTELPTWLGQNLRLMVGAGDLDHGDIPNVQMFSSYDVFFCLPWNNNRTSLRRNVEYLLANFNRSKLLCFIDSKNTDQMVQFSSLFKERFVLVDGHGGHCPHLDFCYLQKILTNNGTALNIFEQTECLLKIEDLEFWFANGHFPNYLSSNLITGRICGDFDRDLLHGRFLVRLRELNAVSNNIKIDEDIISNEENLTLPYIQYCFRSLLFDKELPLNLRGSISNISRDWRDDRIELVIKKVEPDFMIPLLNTYVEKIGATADSDRALYIIEKIIADLEIGSIYSRFKYETFRKHMLKMESLINS